MFINSTLAAKYDVLIAAEEHLYWVKRANAHKPNARVVQVAQRAFDAARANLTDDEMARLDAIGA